MSRHDITVCVSGWAGTDVFGRFQAALYRWEEIRLVSLSQQASKSKRIIWGEFLFQCCMSFMPQSRQRKRLWRMVTHPTGNSASSQSPQRCGRFGPFVIFFLWFFKFELVFEYYTRMKSSNLIWIFPFSGADRGLWHQRRNDSSFRPRLKKSKKKHITNLENYNWKTFSLTEKNKNNKKRSVTTTLLYVKKLIKTNWNDWQKPLFRRF